MTMLSPRCRCVLAVSILLVACGMTPAVGNDAADRRRIEELEREVERLRRKNDRDEQAHRRKMEQRQRSAALLQAATTELSGLRVALSPLYADVEAAKSRQNAAAASHGAAVNDAKPLREEIERRRDVLKTRKNELAQVERRLKSDLLIAAPLLEASRSLKEAHEELEIGKANAKKLVAADEAYAKLVAEREVLAFRLGRARDEDADPEAAAKLAQRIVAIDEQMSQRAVEVATLDPQRAEVIDATRRLAEAEAEAQRKIADAPERLAAVAQVEAARTHLKALEPQWVAVSRVVSAAKARLDAAHREANTLSMRVRGLEGRAATLEREIAEHRRALE